VTEWLICPTCRGRCNIRPLSLLFDTEGKKYGGMWYCQYCQVYYTNHFLSYEQILELKEKHVELEGNGKTSCLPNKKKEV